MVEALGTRTRRKSNQKSKNEAETLDGGALVLGDAGLLSLVGPRQVEDWDLEEGVAISDQLASNPSICPALLGYSSVCQSRLL